MNSFDIEVEQQNRRKKLLEALAAQSGVQAQMVGGHYVGGGLANALAKLGTAYLSRTGAEEADKKIAETEGLRKQDLQTQLGGYDSTNVDSVRNALISQHPELQQIAQMDYTRKPEKASTKYRPLTDEDMKTWGIPPESRSIYKYNLSEEAPEVMDKSPKISANATVGTPLPENVYAKQRAEDEAKQATEFTKAFRAAQPLMRAADQLEVLNNAGVYSGPAANAAAFVSGVAKSLGLPVDEVKLANTQTYKGELANAIIRGMAAAGGAKGLSEKETMILQEAFPKVEVSPEARAQIIQILRGRAQQDIDNYKQFRAWEKRQFPEVEVFEAGGEIAPNLPVQPALGGGVKDPNRGEW